MATTQAFLEQKAASFCALIEANQPDALVKAQLATFSPLLLIPTITTVLVPSAATLAALGATLCDHLTPTTLPRDVLEAKVVRYLQCFVAAVAATP